MAGGGDASDASFDLTPMIDVILLLIIFFMLSSQFAGSQMTPMDLPKEQGAEAVSDDAIAKLAIDVNKDGSYRVLGESLTIDQIIERAKAARPKDSKRPSGIIIRSDRNASAAAVNRLAERLSGAGIDNWSLAVAGDGGGS